jgi:hypothetical protein
MDCSVKKFDLLAELSLTQGVVERKTTIPILSHSQEWLCYPDANLKQAVEEAAGLGVVRVSLFFAQEFAGVGLHAAPAFAKATAGAQWMLDVQHLVEEDVFDDMGRDGGAVEAAIEDDLIERRVKAPELGAPGAFAPGQAGAAEAAGEIAAVEAREHGREVVGHAAGAAVAHSGTGALAAQGGDAAARRGGQGEAPVFVQRFARGAPTEDARKENNGGGFEDAWARAAQGVGQADVCGVLAQADGVRQASVGVELDDELRRAAEASQAGIEAVKEARAAGNGATLRW